MSSSPTQFHLWNWLTHFKWPVGIAEMCFVCIWNDHLPPQPYTVSQKVIKSYESSSKRKLIGEIAVHSSVIYLSTEFIIWLAKFRWGSDSNGERKNLQLNCRQLSKIAELFRFSMFLVIQENWHENDKTIQLKVCVCVCVCVSPMFLVPCESRFFSIFIYLD